MNPHDIPKAPPGWRVDGRAVWPDGTVAGALARGEEVRAVCQRQTCRRSCWIDIEKLIERGYGAVPMAAVERSLKCNDLDGCGLYLIRRPPKTSLALSQILPLDGVTVEIVCGGCRHSKRVLPKSLYDGLPAEERRKVHYLADIEPLLKSACEKCSKTAWRLEPRWPRVVCRGNGWIID